MARLFGLASWAQVEARLALLQQRSDIVFPDAEIRQLTHAIDTNDLEGVKTLMTQNPDLHRAPLGYGKDGPLTWVAECRVPWAAPTPTRLAMAKWMIENGSDVHQGGDGPLMRAALKGSRIPMMELLVAHGADVNAEWHGDFPIIFAPCEALDPEALQWLLERGANPNCANPNRRFPDTALDYVIGTYVRSPERLQACIDLLLDAGGVTKYTAPAVIDLLRGRVDSLREHLARDASLATRHFPDLDCGMSGGRRLTLEGATLLHVAAEYHELEAARLLLEHGIPVNSPAAVDASGIGGQTPLFHAVTHDGGLPVVRLLVERGADLSIRARIPGRYDQPDEVVECTPLGYARLCSDDANESKVATFLKSHRAEE